MQMGRSTGPSREKISLSVCNRDRKKCTIRLNGGWKSERNRPRKKAYVRWLARINRAGTRGPASTYKNGTGRARF